MAWNSKEEVEMRFAGTNNASGKNHKKRREEARRKDLKRGDQKKKGRATRNEQKERTKRKGEEGKKERVGVPQNRLFLYKVIMFLQYFCCRNFRFLFS
jgi:hypothetical protein